MGTPDSRRRHDPHPVVLRVAVSIPTVSARAWAPLSVTLEDTHMDVDRLAWRGAREGEKGVCDSGGTASFPARITLPGGRRGLGGVLQEGQRVRYA